MIEQLWATIIVPHENYVRGQRVRLPKTRRNAELAASGYLLFDPVVTEVIQTDQAPVRTRRGRRPAAKVTEE